jgi:hypothetical protein
MKTAFTTIGILLVSMASAATAAGAGVAKETGKTRAEVRAELMSAISKGERLSAGEAQYYPPTLVLSSRSRAEVRGQVIGALRAGERFAAGEASYEAPVTAGAGRARAEVMNELRAMGAGPGVATNPGVLTLGSGPGADTIYLPGPN